MITYYQPLNSFQDSMTSELTEQARKVIMGKRNFLLPTDAKEAVDELSNEDAGIVFKELFNYVENGTINLKGPLKAFFVTLKKVIDKNEETYQKRCKVLEDNINNKHNEENKTNENDTDILSIRNENDIDTISTQNNINNSSDARHISYNINNNKELIECEEEEKNKISKKSINEESKIIEQIIDYLNEKANTRYKSNTKSTIKNIKARLKEKHQLNEFFKVIDKKTEEWLGTKFEQYLNPDTLFGSKFEIYLNQKINNSLQKEKKRAGEATLEKFKNVTSEPMSDEELEKLKAEFAEFTEIEQVFLDESGNLNSTAALPF